MERRQKKIPMAMAAITATPPTAPPTMAPIGVLDFEIGAGVGDTVVVGVVAGTDVD